MTSTERPSSTPTVGVGDESRVLRRRTIVAEPLGHIPALDGLRAVAVLAVVLYHSRFTWIPGGFLGVSAFFTLSGFLITSLILREWTSTGGLALRPFWTRRFRRLLPASWATLGVVIALGFAGAWNTGQLRALRGDVPYSLAEIVNWHFIAADRSYGAALAAPSPLEHFWSLAVEQQFYVLLPVLIVVVLTRGRSATPRQRLRRLVATLGVLAVVSAVANGLLARDSIERAYYGTDTRMAEMLVGALLACMTLKRLRLNEREWLRWLAVVAGFVASGVTVWLWHDATLRSMWLYPWGLLLTAFSTAAIVFASVQSGGVARALSIPPLRWIGRISYGIYLLHWPIFLVLTPARVGWAPWPLFVLRFAVTVAAASALYHLVEHPIRSGTRLRRPLGLATALVVVPALIAATVVLTRNIAPPTQLEQALAASDSTASNSPASSPTAAPVRVLVIGDRFAESVGKALELSNGVEVTVAAVPFCGLALGGWVTTSGGAVERDVDRCRHARATWIATAQQTRPDVVVAVPGARDVADRRLQYPQAWAGPLDPRIGDFLTTDIGSLVDTLSESTPAVVLLTAPHMRNGVVPDPRPPIPEVPVGAPGHDIAEVEIDRMSEGATAHFAENDATRIDGINDLLRDVARSRGVRLFDLGAETASWREGEFDPRLRPDGVGMGGVGATRVADWLGPLLEDLQPAPRPAAPPPFVDANAPLPAAPPIVPRRTLPPHAAPRVLVVGDSVGVDLALGLGRWSGEHPSEGVDLVSGAMAGCPTARGGSYRTNGDLRILGANCDWAESYPQLVAAHRPDVALLISGPWEVADRRLPGDDRFRHIGDPGIDRYILTEFLTAIDALSANGATVALVVQPHLHAGLDAGLVDLPESEPERIDRLNEILHHAAELRPGAVVLLDLGAWLRDRGQEDDPAVRPDGIHFSDDSSEQVGAWLAGQLRDLAGAR